MTWSNFQRNLKRSEVVRVCSKASIGAQCPDTRCGLRKVSQVLGNFQEQLLSLQVDVVVDRVEAKVWK